MKFSFRIGWARLLGLAVLLAVLGAAVLALSTWLYYRDVRQEVERQFATYRWKVPSRIYSDRQPLFAGMDIRNQQVIGRLERMGYRKVEGIPERPGEFAYGNSMLTIYQRALNHPTFGHPARTLRFTLADALIVRIESEDSPEPLPIVYLEPELLGVLVGGEWHERELVRQQDMPAAVTQAVVAIEDRRFYEHPGVDVRGLLRALVNDIRKRRLAEGGSTLTQQLVKNIILRDSSRTITRKYPEMVMAYAIDREYSKEEILTKYLNEIYFGQHGRFEVRGIGAAARYYFNKPIEEVTLGEAATLAGIIHGPNLYSSGGTLRVDKATARRNLVLDAMYQAGYITEDALRAAKIAPLETARARKTRKLAPYFVDLLRRQLQQDYSLDGLAQEGLGIYTTLQMPVQEAAEQAVVQTLGQLERRYTRLRRSDPQQQLQAAVVVLRPGTGEIVALVGGRDYATTQYDRIHRSMRQPGSLIKPFVFLTALADRDRRFEGGFGPLYPLEDTETTFHYRGVDYVPQNYTRSHAGTLAAWSALARSVNVPAVAVLERTGVPALEQTLRDFGVTTPVADFLPTALGASEMYPIELARAYGALAAGGVMADSRALSSVVDSGGNLLQHSPVELRTAADPVAVAMLNGMLAQVVDHGTAAAIRSAGIAAPLAGKTGTTSDGKDAWFVGYAPDVVALVWVGFDTPTPLGLTGSQAALPIWIDLMQSFDLSGEEFILPEGAEVREIDRVSGGLAVTGCPAAQRIRLVFDAGDEVPACPLHAAAAATAPSAPATLTAPVQAPLPAAARPE